MVPPILGRILSLHPRVLNGEQVRENASLIHADSEELRAALATSRAQLFARGRHGLILTLQLKFFLPAQLRLVEVPGTVNSPMTQVTCSGELEGSRSARVVEEVSNQGDSFIELLHGILSFL